MEASVENLHTAWVTEESTSMWFIVIHGIVPTNKHVRTIRLAESDDCRHCETRETLVHWLTEYNEGTAVWLWTR